MMYQLSKSLYTWYRVYQCFRKHVFNNNFSCIYIGIFLYSVYQTNIRIKTACSLCTIVPTTKTRKIIYRQKELLSMKIFSKQSWKVIHYSYAMFGIYLPHVYFFFFFFWYGHRDQIACSLLGGFSNPRTAAIHSLDDFLI